MKRNKNAKARTILDRSLKVRGKGFLSTTTTPTMLDDQLTNEQHKSISRKNNFSSSFHPSSESYPILPSIANIDPASSTHSTASMQVSLSPMQSSPILPQNKHNANKERNNRYKENSSGPVAYSHPIPPSPIAGVFPEVCRTIMRHA